MMDKRKGCEAPNARDVLVPDYISLSDAMSEVVTAGEFRPRSLFLDAPPFSFMRTTVVPYLTVWQDLLLWSGRPSCEFQRTLVLEDIKKMPLGSGATIAFEEKSLCALRGPLGFERSEIWPRVACRRLLYSRGASALGCSS